MMIPGGKRYLAMMMKTKSCFKLMIGLGFLTFPVLLASCKSASITATERVSGNQDIGFLQGQVVIGPNCPVERVDQECSRDAEVYSAHRLAVLNSDRKEVKTIDLDTRGNFRTDLPAGAYFADVIPHDIGIAGPPEPVAFEITAQQTTTIKIELDTGMR